VPRPFLHDRGRQAAPACLPAGLPTRRRCNLPTLPSTSDQPATLRAIGNQAVVELPEPVGWTNHAACNRLYSVMRPPPPTPRLSALFVHACHAEGLRNIPGVLGIAPSGEKPSITGQPTCHMPAEALPPQRHGAAVPAGWMARMIAERACAVPEELRRLAQWPPCLRQRHGYVVGNMLQGARRRAALQPVGVLGANEFGAS
jgi:hypothetical protein